jgi:hypothetical protein
MSIREILMSTVQQAFPNDKYGGTNGMTLVTNCQQNGITNIVNPRSDVRRAGEEAEFLAKEPDALLRQRAAVAEVEPVDHQLWVAVDQLCGLLSAARVLCPLPALCIESNQHFIHNP